LILNRIIYLISILFLLVSCSKKNTTRDFLEFNLPEGIEIPPKLQSKIPFNGIDLGQRLFNDPLLSSNGKISCASCHKTEFAFAENVALSTEGVSKKELERNSPALFNLAWQKGFFWDGGAHDLVSQVLGPLTSEDELNESVSNVLDKLKADDSYVQQFKEVFKEKGITTLNLLKAIEWYELTLISFNSKYDKFRKEEEVFSKEEKAGLTVYNTYCNDCHTLPLGSSYNYYRNGIDSVFDYHGEDVRLGRNRITYELEDLGKYKAPSLRNLSFTAPYMHDGRFGNLDIVIDHYRGHKPMNSDSLVKKIKLNDEEVTQLKSFLLTMNDYEFVKE